jgi:endonuclease I
MKRPCLVLWVLVLAAGQSAAQYLEVRRSASIKEEHNAAAAIIEMVGKGTNLQLLDNGLQEDGYYKVRATSVDRTGWIYRTLVRRHEGTIPGTAASTTSSISFNPPADYYSATVNLTGTALKAALHTIIRDHKEFSYGEVWDILKETDADLNNPSNVIGIYSGFSMDADKEYDGGKGWNREHVWAKSRGDFGTSQGAGTDLHHLRAEDASTNSARNNRSFDECDEPYEDDSGTYKGMTQSFTSTASWTWEPRDAVKGDVARMLFYMVVRYEGEDEEPDLELVESIDSDTSKKPEHARLSTLKQWHSSDPVDSYERRRNDLIYRNYQKNRNPFIDHPEFVAMIWGSN